MLHAVVPCHPKDFQILNFCLQGIIENLSEVSKIWVISAQDPGQDLRQRFGTGTDGVTVEWFDEAKFPFSMADIKQYTQPHPASWYLQQLLKLYSCLVIPGISSNVLVVDADVVFLRPVKFLVGSVGSVDPTEPTQSVDLTNTTQPKPCYYWSTQYYDNYFQHMLRLHPDFTRNSDLSGICHHIIYQKRILQEIFAQVEDYHQTVFWRAFMSCVKITAAPEAHGSAASEYEIYFHYIRKHHPDEHVLRPLTMRDFFCWPLPSREQLDRNRDEGLDYVAYHNWL